MNNKNLNTTAVHVTAQAVIFELLCTDRVVSVSVVPRGNALGFAQYQPEQTRPLPTLSEMENNITTILAGLAAESLVDGAERSVELLRRAHALAIEIADKQTPDWCITDQNLPSEIALRCRARAVEWVTAHKDRILKVADVLVEKGTLTGDELAAL